MVDKTSTYHCIVHTAYLSYDNGTHLVSSSELKKHFLWGGVLEERQWVVAWFQLPESCIHSCCFSGILFSDRFFSLLFSVSSAAAVLSISG